MVTLSTGGGVKGEQAARNGISDQAGVGAVKDNVRSELPAGGKAALPVGITVPVDMPAYVAELVGGQGFGAAFIPKGSSIIDSHVEGVGCEIAVAGVGVGGFSDGGTHISRSGIRLVKEIGKRGGGIRGGNSGVEGTREGAPVGELEVV